TPASPDLANIDICSQVAAKAALTKTVTGVTVTDGVLDIKSVYGSADDPELAAIEVVPSSSSPAPQIGQWSPVLSFPVVAVDTILTPTGNVLMWDIWGNSPRSENLWNPSTGTFVPVPYNVGNRFCAGHVNLADGRTLVVGGWDGVNAETGIAAATAFDPDARTWVPQANMAHVRWYPTVTTLGDGRVLAY